MAIMEFNQKYNDQRLIAFATILASGYLRLRAQIRADGKNEDEMNATLQSAPLNPLAISRQQRDVSSRSEGLKSASNRGIQHGR